MRFRVDSGGIRYQRLCVVGVTRPPGVAPRCPSNTLLVRRSHHRGRHQAVSRARSIRRGVLHAIQMQPEDDSVRLSPTTQVAPNSLLGHEGRNQRRGFRSHNSLCAHQRGLHFQHQADDCTGRSSPGNPTIRLVMDNVHIASRQSMYAVSFTQFFYITRCVRVSSSP